MPTRAEIKAEKERWEARAAKAATTLTRSELARWCLTYLARLAFIDPPQPSIQCGRYSKKVCTKSS